MITAYIGIGSNLGDRQNNCRTAVHMIGLIPGCELKRLSKLYLTEPVGVEGQGWYLNAVAEIYTSVLPHDLINRILEIEADMGRIRKGRWEPRIIDLDILMYGNEIINEGNLTIPHPLLHERRFVLSPISDLVPDLVHPIKGKTMAQLLKEIPENGQEVRPIKDQ